MSKITFFGVNDLYFSTTVTLQNIGPNVLYEVRPVQPTCSLCERSGFAGEGRTPPPLTLQRLSLPQVDYMRNVDPDQEQPWTGGELLRATWLHEGRGGWVVAAVHRTPERYIEP